MPNDTSTRQLISTIESKDRKFRIAQAIFMGLVFLILAGVIAIQQMTLAGVEQQLIKQEQLLEQQKRDTDEIKSTVAKVSKQLDCIAQYFSQRNRAEARITNLEQCVIVRDDGSIVELQNFDTPAQQSPQPQPQLETISPNQPGLAPLNPQQPENPATPETPEEPPVEVLGIPVCVPLTGICIR